MPRHVDLQRPRTEHPPAESGFKTKAINGTIGTLSVYITVDYAEYQAEMILRFFLSIFYWGRQPLDPGTNSSLIALNNTRLKRVKGGPCCKRPVHSGD